LNLTFSIRTYIDKEYHSIHIVASSTVTRAKKSKDCNHLHQLRKYYASHGTQHNFHAGANI